MMQYCSSVMQQFADFVLKAVLFIATWNSVSVDTQ